MPRKARIVEPGVPMHITQRGNDRQDIFKSDEDKAFYIKNFMFYKRKFKVKVYAWALMDNHIHFVLEPTSKKSIGKLFHALNTKYVLYFNRKHEKSGRLFSDRCYSSLLDDDHLYEAVRYVELNPYRAKMETRVATYLWTSARERLRKIETRFLSKLNNYFIVNDWLEYLQSAIENLTIEVKQSWVNLRRHTHRSIPLGNQNFLSNLEEKLQRCFKIRFRKTMTWRT